MTHTATVARQLVRDDLTTSPAAPPGRGWAGAGLLAGLFGAVGIVASLQVDAVYADKYAGNAAAITERLGDFVPQILVMHTSLLLATVLLLVFAAGLKRRLAAQAPAGSILPDVAASGLWLTSVAGLMGTALNTEMVFAVSDSEARLVPEVGALWGHWIGTVPWLWLGAGVMGVALAIASLKHGAAPRWIGFVAAFLGGLTLIAGVSPLQYMAGFFGPLLVLVAGAGFRFGDRVR